MNCTSDDVAMLERVCCGDREAMDFIANHWMPYAGEVDDIIDGHITTPEQILNVFARAAYLYTHPFFVKHAAVLRTLILLCTNTFADTVAWEKSPDDWKRQWADHHRHTGMDVVLAVAMICGGYEHARLCSQEQRSLCYHEHHNRKGEAE